MGQPIRGITLLASAFLISLCIFVCLATQVFAAKYVTFSRKGRTCNVLRGLYKQVQTPGATAAIIEMLAHINGHCIAQEHQ